MHKIFSVIILSMLITSGARAVVDYSVGVGVDYPWAESCSGEIDEYCAATDYDLYDCMAQHEEFLGDDCFGDFIAFDRGRGIRDEGMRGRWNGMDAAQRADFRADRAGDGHFAPLHNGVAGGGEHDFGGGHGGGGHR